MRSGILALAFFLALFGCQGEDEVEEEPTLGVGGCVNTSNPNQYVPVACEDPAADAVIVRSLGPIVLPGSGCDEHHTVMEVTHYYEGRRLGQTTYQCIVNVDAVTAADRDAIERRTTHLGLPLVGPVNGGDSSALEPGACLAKDGRGTAAVRCGGRTASWEVLAVVDPETVCPGLSTAAARVEPDQVACLVEKA